MLQKYNKLKLKHAILDMVETICNNMDKRRFSCGVFIDLKKAFDTVNHKILLDKLNYYGFRGIVNKWFSSYLTNRTQTTKTNSYISDKEAVSCGVPQTNFVIFRPYQKTVIIYPRFVFLIMKKIRMLLMDIRTVLNFLGY